MQHAFRACAFTKRFFTRAGGGGRECVDQSWPERGQGEEAHAPLGPIVRSLT